VVYIFYFIVFIVYNLIKSKYLYEDDSDDSNATKKKKERKKINL
jgi:hypothetical protein